MSEAADPLVGVITSRDLTAPIVGAVSEFPQAVVGWEVRETPMGDYCNYSTAAPGPGEVLAGELLDGPRQMGDARFCALYAP
ncbi:MAG: hypothetical protein ACO1SX_11405 [Actinomycetota bacterium]